MMSHEVRLRDSAPQRKPAARRADLTLPSPRRAVRPAEVDQERYRLLLDTINDGLLQVDQNLTIQFVNHQFAQTLGYIEAELLGHRSADFLDEATRQSIPDRVERRKAGIAE